MKPSEKSKKSFPRSNGKPAKFNRLRHVVHLWNRRLIDDGLINCLKQMKIKDYIKNMITINW